MMTDMPTTQSVVCKVHRIYRHADYVDLVLSDDYELDEVHTYAEPAVVPDWVVDGMPVVIRHDGKWNIAEITPVRGTVAPIQRVEREMIYERGATPHMAEMWLTFHTYGRQIHKDIGDAERWQAAQYLLGR